MIKGITRTLATTLLIFAISGFVLSPRVIAGSLTSMSDTVTNLSATAVANHTIVFTTPTGIAAGATLILTFDNSTSIHTSMTYTDMDLLDDGTNVTLAASAAGTTWGAVRTSGTVITFTNGSTPVVAGSIITIKIGTNAASQSNGVYQIANGSAGTTSLTFSGTFGDSGVLSMPIITNSIVSLAATVLPTISFTISHNAIYFGNLTTANTCWAQNTDPGNVTCPTQTETEAFNMTAATNGTGGYTLTVQGATLTSGANTITALASATAPNPANEQFGLRMNVSGAGSATVPATYGTAGQYAYTATASTAATVASTAVATLSNTFSVRYIANISPITESGSYTTSHTYIATGNF